MNGKSTFWSVFPALVVAFAMLGSTLLWPLVIIGLMFNFAVYPGTIWGNLFLWIGVIFFGLAVILDLITLPVEYNASKRAVDLLSQTEILNEEETVGAKKVLNAAALTYVASLLNSMLNLIRFLLVFLVHSRRND